MKTSVRSGQRFDQAELATLTRAQLAVRAQSLRERRRIIEALELVRDWTAAQRAAKSGAR